MIVFRFFKTPHKITIEEHLSWYEDSYLHNDKRMDWICREKETKNRIGVFGLSIDGDRAEVNYLLAKESQGKGYATEAVTGLMEYASKELGCQKVTAEIHEENELSILLVERLGFKLTTTKKPFLDFEKEL